MSQNKEKQIQTVDEQKMIELLTDRENGYGLFQGDSANLTGDEKDAGTPVIFTPRETLTIERLAEIVLEISAQAQQEAVQDDRKKWITVIKNLRFRIFQDNEQLARLFDPIIEALQTKGQK